MEVRERAGEREPGKGLGSSEVGGGREGKKSGKVLS